MEKIKLPILILAIFLCFVFLKAKEISREGEWHPEKNYWPRTVIDSSSAAVEQVRNRILNVPFSTIYAGVVSTSDISYTGLSKEVQKARVCRCAAFRYLMGNNIFYADKAKEYLLEAQREPYNPLDLEERYNNIIWDAELLSMLCIAYDFLKANNYDFSEDEQTIRDILQSIAASLYNDSNWWLFILAEAIKNNYGVKLASAVGMAAIVLNTQGSSQENEQPQTWINFAMNSLYYQFNEYLVDQEGGWAEGAHYMKFSAPNFLPFAIAHNNFVNGEAELYDGQILSPLLQEDNFINNAVWGLKIRRPDGFRPNFDDSFNEPNYYNGMLAGYLENDVLAWDFVRASVPYNTDSSSGNIDIEIICTWNEDYPGITVPAYSETQFLPYAGQAVFRSDWYEDAVYMCLLGERGIARIGGKGHEHSDNTSFIIYAYGELLAMDSGYINWSNHDLVRFPENHSLILVDGEGPPSPSSFPFTQGVDSFIENYFDTDQFDYTEISTSYQNTDITRCASFIDNSYFVITDFLSASSNHDYDWLLHGNGGGNTGNAHNLITNGAVYTVNDVDLYLFLNSTESVTFSSYDDYHEESYANAGEHTVTRGSVYGQNVIYSAFLIPLNERDSLEYFPINTGNANGGYIVHNSKKTLNLVKENYSLVSINFGEDEISFDSKSLIMVQNELENPEVVFLKDGQTLIYNDTPLIQCSEVTNFNLNISDTSAKGFINNGCEVQLYTGNEPTQVTGADSYSFSNGILTLLFSDNTNFTIEVIWQLELLTPVNLIISISGNEIILSWEHSVGATGYKIYSSEDPQLNLEDWILEDTVQDVNYWTTTITNNKKFFYVKAVRVWP